MNLATYYQRRAAEYDAVYARPERQADLRRLQDLVPPLFAERDVLEVAAGTGYWTRLIAASARTIYATDYNPAPLAIAAEREYPRSNVRFGHADAFELDRVDGVFDAAFVGFWWSHIGHSDIDRFLTGLCARLQPESPVAIVDNRYVPGSSSPISRTDADGNTYQRRPLDDGSVHEIVKNFPTTEDLHTAVRTHGSDVSVTELEYFWLLTFTTS